MENADIAQFSGKTMFVILAIIVTELVSRQRSQSRANHHQSYPTNEL